MDAHALAIMIQSFRVHELQMLLGYAGQNKHGKKDDLLTRAIGLVRLGSIPLQTKIREIYVRAQTLQDTSEDMRNITGHQQVNNYSGMNYANMSTAMINAAYGAAQALHERSSYGAVSLPTSGPAYPPNQVVASEASMAYNNQCQIPPSLRLNMPHLSAVDREYRLTSLPFYEVTSELVKPLCLMSTSSIRFHETHMQFKLTAAQATDVASNRDTANGSRLEYPYQIQLRFCRIMEPGVEMKDEFPQNITVNVNDKLVSLPSPIPTNRAGVEPKRPPKPVNISPYVKLSPVVTNVASVKWPMECSKCFVVGIWLVKKLTSADLLEQLIKKGTRHSNFTRILIQDKLNEDDEVETTSLTVSVACPLGKMRMSLPCRPSTCTHLQCFDASLFLQMNERKSTWNCPVCDKPATFDTLMIDGYFQDVLASNKLHSDENDIVLKPDGSWCPTGDSEDEKPNLSQWAPSNGNSTPAGISMGDAASAAVTCIILSDEEDEIVPPVSADIPLPAGPPPLPPLPSLAPPLPPPPPVAPPPPPDADIECISLD